MIDFFFVKGFLFNVTKINFCTFHEIYEIGIEIETNISNLKFYDYFNIIINRLNNYFIRIKCKFCQIFNQILKISFVWK